MILPNFSFEQSLLPLGTRYLLGIDEVGRGPWAGPVTVGAFLLDLQNFSPDEFSKINVRDSKKLSSSQRQNIHQYFVKNNHHFKTFSKSSLEIDQQGIAVCIQQLINAALEFYSSQFDYCLIDGNYKVVCPVKGRGTREAGGRVLSVVKGDQKCFSIAAASIVAKVDRDSQMAKFDTEFPHYGFKSHKGYGTKQHLEALTLHGPCSIHRLSYKPLAGQFPHHNSRSHR